MMPATPPPLTALYSMQPTASEVHAPFSGLRLRAQREAAYTIAVQAGASWRYQQIDDYLHAQRINLDTLYNFSPLMLDNGRVAPPVVVQGGENLDVQSARMAQAALATWEIVSDARIVSTPPNWRGYLIQHFNYDLTSVNPALLPRNDSERAAWHIAVDKGWRDGVAEANYLFDLNLSRLVRDFVGMARFHLLAAEHVVSLPYLADGNLGVVVNNNRLVVGAHIYRITKLPAWQEPGEWKASPYSPNP